MGQRIPPPLASLEDEAWADIDGRGPLPSTPSGAKRLVGRISEALQVSQAALYQPPNAVTPARGRDGDGAIGLDGECAALLRAFRRIRDDDDRRRLLAVVQAAAERA